ncbi:predicted protein [Nematostella vectensis]|uniref:Endothelin-converting enzyme 1 n=1 Tax=Nematostella vectensis TaxID=45351 RepID=A7SWD6_NEMVE|nr:predicted protein [Nematostella vectensis]|eukprot:XP_001624095.1 predicted protein [Nematostella vectensis]
MGLGWRFVLLVALVALSEGQSSDRMDAQVCYTANCNATANDTLEQPCNNFYRYACGGWIRSHPLTNGQVSADRYEKLREENEEFVKGFIKNAKARAEYQQVSAVQKLFKYYDSCMNMIKLDRLDAAPLTALLQDYAPSKLLQPDWNGDDWDLESSVARLVKELGAKSLFEVKVELDADNSSFYFISLKQPSKFSIPRHQLSQKAAGKEARNKLLGLMKNITNALGADQVALAKWLPQVIRFERRLEKAALPDNSITTEVMSIRDFQLLVDPISSSSNLQIDWQNLLQEIFSDTQYQITSNTKIIVNGLRYFKKMIKYLKKTPKQTIANYLTWKLAQDFHLKLGQRFSGIHKHYQTSIGGLWAQGDRQEKCMEELSSLQGFAMPLTRIFVDKKFQQGNKKWLSTWRPADRYGGNKEKANKDKANALMEVIGYPDWIMNNTLMNTMFDDIDINPSTYFENTISLVKSWVKRQYQKAGKPKNPQEWTMSPVEINAQYEDSYNRMVFPVAILQPPFYDSRYNGAVNFGGIGSVIGHELTHGFDDSGKRYDSKGSQVEWWTDITSDEFKTRADCLVSQYGSFTFNGKNVDGNRTLSENIADNGGLKQAYKAYMSWVGEYGEEQMLPELGLTNEQVFFVSFAQNWCTTYDSSIDDDKKSNYSPTPIRVNGSLRNFAKFAEAFQCADDSPMSPKQKCPVW